MGEWDEPLPTIQRAISDLEVVINILGLESHQNSGSEQPAHYD